MGLSAENLSGGNGMKIDPDLQVIYEGGENFLGRMTALQKAKQESTDALKALNLGNDINAVHADAKAKQEAVSAALADAQAKSAIMLSDAKTAAEKIVSDANSERDRIVAEASVSGDAAAKKLSDADAALKDAQAQAAKILRDAANTKTQLDTQMAEIPKMKADLTSAKGLHEKATAKAEKLAATLQAKLDSLTASIAQVTQSSGD